MAHQVVGTLYWLDQTFGQPWRAMVSKTVGRLFWLGPRAARAYEFRLVQSRIINAGALHSTCLSLWMASSAGTLQDPDSIGFSVCIRSQACSEGILIMVLAVLGGAFGLSPAIIQTQRQITITPGISSITR